MERTLESESQEKHAPVWRVDFTTYQFSNPQHFRTRRNHGVSDVDFR